MPIAPGIQLVAQRTSLARGLVAYYPLSTDFTLGGALIDYSGNGRNAAPNGVWAQVEGPYGYAVQLASGAYNSIRIPVSALDYTQPWTCLVLVRATSGASLSQQGVLKFWATSLFYSANLQIDANQYVTGGGNLAAPHTTLNDWQWMCLGTDPTAVTKYLHQLNPSIQADLKVAHSSPAGAFTILEIGANNTGTLEIGALAVWQRLLTRPEVMDWINMPLPPMLPNMILPRVLSTQAAVNPASLNAGLVQTLGPYTVTGANMGDAVQVSHSVSLGGTHIWGEVTSTNNVTVYQQNPTAGAVDVASGTLRIYVTKYLQ